MKRFQIISLYLFGLATFFAGHADAQINWINLSSDRGEIPVPNGGDEQTCSVVCDIDRDGKDDFVIGERTASPAVVWYRYNGKTFDRYLIEDTKLTPEAGGDSYDIDGDGDLDIVLGEDVRGSEIWWWENPYPNFDKPWKRRYIQKTGKPQHHDLSFGDYDGDGKTELVAWNQRDYKMLMYEIPDDPKNADTWKSTVIYNYEGDFKLEGFAEPPVDIDQDGLIDIVGGGRWFKYKGDAGFQVNVLDERRKAQISAGQLVKGGYSEIVVSPGDADGPITWYEWKDGKWQSHDLRYIIHGHTVQVRDVDKDGNLDIFAGEMGSPGNGANARVFIFYGDGKGHFKESVAYKGQGIHSSKLGDFNGDGYLDILVKPYHHNSPHLEVLLSEGRKKLSLDKWQRYQIATLPTYAVFSEPGDLDNDGWPDIIAGKSWWKNPGRADGKWVEKEIGEHFNNLATAYDYDLDGDLDILGTEGEGATPNHKFVLAENNGKGEFKIIPVADTKGRGDFLQGCQATNFGDKNMVVLSWHNGDEGIKALEVPAPENIEGPWDYKLLSPFTMKEDISVGDIDKDGDEDLLLGTSWLQNNGGNWSPVKIGDIPEGEPDRNELADINGDGRLDAVIGIEMSEKLFWFEAPADPTQPWIRHEIGTIEGMGFSQDVADFDNDGDMDLVIGEHRGQKVNRVIIFENQKKGSKWKQHVIDSGPSDMIDHHDGTQVVDIDHDGDLDIISVSWYNQKVWLFENKAIE